MTPAKARLTPRQTVERACADKGRDAAIDGFLALIDGDDSDGELIYLLAGEAGRWAVAGGEPGPDYWLRVWGIRALLYAWDDRAIPWVDRGLLDEAWRVREAAAKVCARHRIDKLTVRLASLRDGDATPRVRQAAARALDRIIAAT